MILVGQESIEFFFFFLPSKQEREVQKLGSAFASVDELT